MSGFAEPPASSGAKERRSRQTLRDVRIRYAPAILGVACLALAVRLLIAGRAFHPFADEWAFIPYTSGWGFWDYFAAHNEHWSTIPMISYRLMLGWFGLSSYLPHLAVVVALHVASVFLLFAEVRRRAGDLVALAGAALTLLVAQGSENLFWAFQVGFVGSVACGLLAIRLVNGLPAAVTPRWRGIAAGGLLVLGLAFSGVGLSFVVAVAVMVLIDKQRRRWWWLLGPPAVAYAAWHLAFGAQAADHHRDPFSLEAVSQLVSYVPAGVGSGLAGTLSLGPTWGPLLLTVAAAGYALLARSSGAISPLALGAAAALLAQYALTGLVRAQFGDAQATSSRYVYIAAFYLVLIFADVAAHLPWHGWWRVVAGVALLAVLVNDVRTLNRRAYEHRVFLGPLVVAQQTTWLLRDAPDLDRQTLFYPLMGGSVTVQEYLQIRRKYGNPLPEPTVESLLARHPREFSASVNRVLPLRITAPSAAAPDGAQCREVGPDDTGLAVAQTVRVPVVDRTLVTITTLSTVTGDIGVGQVLVHPDVPAEPTPLSLRGDESATVTVGAAGLDLPRELEIQVPAGTRAAVCVADPP